MGHNPLGASWFGGLKEGISTTLLGVFLSGWFLVEPYHSLFITHESEKLRIVLLFGVGCMLSLLISRSRDTERQALNSAMERESQLRNEIAERERTLQQRLELEDMLAKILATAPGVICSFRLRPDGTTCFPYASPTINEIYGINPEALKEDAAPIFALVHPLDVTYLNKSITQSAQHLSPWHAEYRVRHPTKGEIWVEGHSIPGLFNAPRLC